MTHPRRITLTQDQIQDVIARTPQDDTVPYRSVSITDVNDRLTNLVFHGHRKSAEALGQLLVKHHDYVRFTNRGFWLLMASAAGRSPRTAGYFQLAQSAGTCDEQEPSDPRQTAVV